MFESKNLQVNALASEVHVPAEERFFLSAVEAQERGYGSDRFEQALEAMKRETREELQRRTAHAV